MTSILRAEGVSKRFGGLQVLSDITLQLRPGQVHSVVGPNGAGKSTLFDVLTGVQRPDSGRVFLAERDISRTPLWRRARLGIVRKFQTPTVFTNLTVRDNLRTAACGRRRLLELARRSGDDERVAQTLEQMGLAGIADAPAAMLAHGEQQRLEIAMTLVTDPTVLLLDEPAAGATRPEAHQMAALLRELGRSLAVLVVEHDLRFIRQVSDWVTVLDRGRQIAQGDVDTVSADREVRSVFLGRQSL
jgi:ABC-type uncharacterized transport system ATPase subunit